jgi:hypothetical protein
MMVTAARVIESRIFLLCLGFRHRYFYVLFYDSFLELWCQPHRYATYGIVPSTAPSSEDESEDTLPRATINAPIEALQDLANAAAEAAAAVPSGSRCGYILMLLLLYN